MQSSKHLNTKNKTVCSLTLLSLLNNLRAEEMGTMTVLPTNGKSNLTNTFVNVQMLTVFHLTSSFVLEPTEDLDQLLPGSVSALQYLCYETDYPWIDENAQLKT